MSFHHTSWVMKRSEEAGSGRLLLLILAHHANDQHEAYPSVGTLVEESRLARSTVIATLRSMAERGVIERVGPHPEPRYKGVIVYRLPDPFAPSPAVEGVQGAEGSESRTGPDEASEGSGDRTQKTKGKDQSSSSTSGEPDELATDAAAMLKAKAKVGSRVVTSEEMAVAVEALRAFNRCSGSRYGLGAHLTSIVGRARERPSWDAAQHVRLVESAWRLRWWEQNGHRREGRRPTPAVIYGNERVFEAVVQDAIEEAKQRKEGSTASPASQAKRFVRKRPRGEL